MMHDQLEMLQISVTLLKILGHLITTVRFGASSFAILHLVPISCTHVVRTLI